MSRSSRAARARVRTGAGPRLRVVPPSRSASIRVTWALSSRACRAAVRPAGPPPRTTSLMALPRLLASPRSLRCRFARGTAYRACPERRGRRSGTGGRRRAGGQGRASSSPALAVVTNSVARSGPPNAHEVGRSTGRRTVVRTEPSGAYRWIAPPPHNATQIPPSSSTVSPSGTTPGCSMCTRVRRLLMSPLSLSKSNASTRPVPLSARYMVAPSGLQPMPLEMVRPVKTLVQLPSNSSRYSAPIPGDSS